MTGLKGVVLAGGRSSRMGSDKAGLSMCGEDELDRVAGRLQLFCDEVWISVRPDQQNDTRYEGFRLLPDPPGIEGPIAGIAAAFRYDPESAWLSIAVDMPYVGSDELELLVTARAVGGEVCCFYNRELDGPEPLLGLFEPIFGTRLNQFLGAGGRGLYRLLSETPHTFVLPPRESALQSINTPTEYSVAHGAICPDE